jgi:hypothetical protein
VVVCKRLTSSGRSVGSLASCGKVGKLGLGFRVLVLDILSNGS